MKYTFSTDLSGRIANLNLPWNVEPTPEKNQNTQFKRAMKICEQTLIHKLYGMILINLPAKELVEKAFK